MDLQNISQSSAAKLEILRNSDSNGLRLFKGYAFEVATITELGLTGEPGLLLDLAGFALHRNAKVREAAKTAVNRLLPIVPIERLLELDTSLRRSVNYWDKREYTWSAYSPTTVASLTAPNDLGVLALASMHPNGRVREAALRILAHHNTGQALPFLLIRVNDWADAVRTLACEIVRQNVRADQADNLLKALPLILRLERCERAQNRWLVESVCHLLVQPECASVLQQGFASPSREIRRACFRFAVGSKAALAENALRVALEDPDPMARLWAAQQLLTSPGPDLYVKLARDPFMPVRRARLEALIEHHGADLSATLQTALLDRHSALRELARFHLKTTFDVPQFYRNMIAQSKGAQLAIALRGLADAGNGNDADAIIAWFDAPEIRLRKAAVHAVGRLAAKRFQDDLFRMLTDRSPGVSAEARTALEPIAQELELQHLASLLKQHPSTFVRRNVLGLIARRSQWSKIALLLAACRDPAEQISKMATSVVEKWFLRADVSSYTVKPSASELSEATIELQQSQEFLSARVARGLARIFAFWRK